MNFRPIRCLSRILTHRSAFSDCGKCGKIIHTLSRTSLYSTSVAKQVFDVFEIFTDVLNFDRTRDSIIKTNIISRFENKETGTQKIDSILNCIDISNLEVSKNILADELDFHVEKKDWGAVEKILQYCIDSKVLLNQSTILPIAEKFCNVGFVDGLRSLLPLCGVSEPEDCMLRGELLHYLAKCHWITNNARECILVLHECSEKHPELLNMTKKLLRLIIYEAVSGRSEAELVNIVDFVHRFTEKCEDYYPLAVLWNYLFISEWYTDNKLADELMEKNENLRICVSLMSSSLTRYLIQNCRVNDVYRMLQTLLKYQMMESYSSVTQILFDYYCSRRDMSTCSEIVKTSVSLKAPLRDEQYNQFISWSVSGDPLKYVNRTDIERIYSKF